MWIIVNNGHTMTNMMHNVIYLNNIIFGTIYDHQNQIFQSNKWHFFKIHVFCCKSDDGIMTPKFNQNPFPITIFLFNINQKYRNINYKTTKFSINQQHIPN